MNDDKRQEFRLTTEEVVVFVELETLPGPEGGKREVVCVAKDVSTNGMRFELDCVLQKHAIHNIRIAMPDAEYKLVAEIMWCEPMQSFGFLVGASFFDSVDTDIIAWKEALAQIL